MVYKEQKMKLKFSALFVCNYPLIHTRFSATCCHHTIKMHIKTDWKVRFTVNLYPRIHF